MCCFFLIWFFRYFQEKVLCVAEALAAATANPYSYMLIYLRAETPDKMRIVENLERDNSDPMIIFSPTV